MKTKRFLRVMYINAFWLCQERFAPIVRAVLSSYTDMDKRDNLDGANTEDDQCFGYRPGDIVDLLGLGDLFDREPERDAALREDRLFTVVEAADPPSRKENCTANEIPHPVRPGRKINVRHFGRDLEKRNIPRMLFTSDILLKGSAERLASICRQLAASGDYFRSTDIDQTKVNDWSTKFLRQWLKECKEIRELPAAAIDSASLAELRDVWFACVAGIAHGRLAADVGYQKEVVIAVKVLRLAQAGNDEGRKAVAKAISDWNDLKPEEHSAGGSACWTEHTRSAGLRLDAVKGSQIMSRWYKGSQDR